MADIDVVDVLLHGEPIGSLTRLDGDRTLFGFRDAYVEDVDRPVLGLCFRDRFGGLITTFRPTRTRLPPYFSNPLPEGRLRTYLAERAGVHADREFFLLRALGLDLPGAVTIRSLEGVLGPPGDPVTAGRGGRAGGAGQRQALRFSLAGLQLKFSALEQARGGLTIPAEAGRPWPTGVALRRSDDGSKGHRNASLPWTSGVLLPCGDPVRPLVASLIRQDEKRPNVEAALDLLPLLCRVSPLPATRSVRGELHRPRVAQ